MTAPVTKRTYCRFCAAGCPIEVDVLDNRVVKVRADAQDPVYGGFTCIKGRNIGEQHHFAGRLRTSFRRDAAGVLAAVTSQAAVGEIADAVGKAIASHGPRSVAFYVGTSQYQNAVAKPMVRAFLSAIGSPSYYSASSIDQPAKYVAPLCLGQWAAGPQPFDTADVCLAAGVNTPISMVGWPGGPPPTNPVMAIKKARARGLKLLVVDPRRSELARMSSLHLQLRPGTDALLFAAILHVILAERLNDQMFCDAWVSGLEELRQAVGTWSPEVVEDRVGVAAGLIYEAARMFATAARGCAISATGTNMGPDSTLVEHLVQSLNVICGRFARAGERLENFGGILGDGQGGPWQPPIAQVIGPNPQALTSGAPSRIRGLRAIAGESPTATLAEEILMPGSGQIRVLIVMGGNPITAWPNESLTRQALSSLDFLAVLDAHMSATATLADVVVGTTLSLERPDVSVTMDRWRPTAYSYYTQPVLEPEGDVIAESMFLIGLAQRLGHTLQLAGGPVPPAALCTPDLLLELTHAQPRIPMSELRSHEGGREHPDLAVTVLPAEPDAKDRFDLNPPVLAAQFSRAVTRQPHRTHKYLLTVRRMRNVLNSQGQQLASLVANQSTNTALVHPDDLEVLGIADGNPVEIVSDTGSTVATASASTDVKPGTVSMPHGWQEGRGGAAAALTDPRTDYDLFSGMPQLSAIPVTLRRPYPRLPVTSGTSSLHQLG